MHKFPSLYFSAGYPILRYSSISTSFFITDLHTLVVVYLNLLLISFSRSSSFCFTSSQNHQCCLCFSSHSCLQIASLVPDAMTQSPKLYSFCCLSTSLPSMLCDALFLIRLILDLGLSCLRYSSCLLGILLLFGVSVKGRCLLPHSFFFSLSFPLSPQLFHLFLLFFFPLFIYFVPISLPILMPATSISCHLHVLFCVSYASYFVLIPPILYHFHISSYPSLLSPSPTSASHPSNLMSKNDLTIS